MENQRIPFGSFLGKEPPVWRERRALSRTMPKTPLKPLKYALGGVLSNERQAKACRNLFKS